MVEECRTTGHSGETVCSYPTIDKRMGCLVSGCRLWYIEESGVDVPIVAGCGAEESGRKYANSGHRSSAKPCPLTCAVKSDPA